jgi:hypothetical protein
MRRKRIQQVAAEQVEGEQLLKDERKAVKRAKGKLAKDNRTRALKAMKKSVEALADQKEIIERGGEIPVD